jgi:hypothetical protein
MEISNHHQTRGYATGVTDKMVFASAIGGDYTYLSSISDFLKLYLLCNKSFYKKN